MVVTMRYCYHITKLLQGQAALWAPGRPRSQAALLSLGLMVPSILLETDSLQFSLCPGPNTAAP